METTDEIGHELSLEVQEKGGEVQYVPCLNDDDQWCKDFSEFAYRQAESSQEEKSKDFYQLEKKDYEEMPAPKNAVAPLSDNAKSSLKIVFLTLFLDLVGFSIIFPLFPALAKHYIAVDGDNFFLKLIFGSITSFAQTGGASNFNSIVLFGGASGHSTPFCNLLPLLYGVGFPTESEEDLSFLFQFLALPKLPSLVFLGLLYTSYLGPFYWWNYGW